MFSNIVLEEMLEAATSEKRQSADVAKPPVTSVLPAWIQAGNMKVFFASIRISVEVNR
jgi:hypothetical protein